MTRNTVAGKRFFISHSSADKPLALEVKSELAGDAWVDLHEIDVGDVLLSEISAGIEAASDFVLLWSAASSRSRWVNFELHMAFVRWLEDQAIAIKVVTLDDAPVPLHLRPFLQARRPESAAALARAISGIPSSASARRLFLNRNQQVGTIEDALYSARTVALWICGVPGVGKRSLAREAMNRVTAGVGVVRSIRVTAGVSEPELDLLVASALGIEPTAEGLDPEQTLVRVCQRVREFAASGGVWLFEDAEHWLTDDGRPGRVLTSLLDAVAAETDQAGHILLFTSRRKPQVGERWHGAVEVLFLDGLAGQHAVPLLRAHGAKGTDDELRQVAGELDGHPLALEVVAPRLPLPLPQLSDHRNQIATDLIDPASIAVDTWRMLETLSLIDGPISGESLAEFFGMTAEEFQAHVAEASAYSLVRLGVSGSLALHPLLRDYFLRSYRKQPAHVERTSQLADILQARLATLPVDDDAYVESLIATVRVLGLAGRFDEGRALRQGLFGTLHQTAVELYQEKRYQEALQYIDEALTGVDEIDFDVLRLKAKTLAYLGRFDEARKLGDELIRANPTSGAAMRDRGRVEFVARNWSDAVVYFERAIPLRRDPSQLWADIAQARVRMRDWTGASAAAKTAIDLGGDTPYALSLYSQALEQQGEFAEAEAVMRRAVSREPSNPSYRHRLGRIAHQRGNKDEAIAQFKAALAIDATVVESWVSLASVLVDVGQFEEAAAALASVESKPGAPLAVVDNVRARIALLTGDLQSAETSAESALKRRRDSQNLVLMIRVLIARGESGLASVGQVQARVKLLAKELDAEGDLQMVVDLANEHPKYF